MPYETQVDNLLPTVRDGQQLHWVTFLDLELSCTRILKRGLQEGPPTPEEFERAVRRSLWAIDKHRPGSSVKISSSLAVFEAAAAGAPYRGQAYHQILRILHAATGLWQRKFVVRVLGPLALWVLDLPASASYHHAYRYGLLDHALEVALASLTECGLKIWPQDHLHCGDPTLPGRVLRLAVTFGLLHDIGKVFGVEVRDEKSGDVWDPLREPLVFFKIRHHLPLFSPTRFKFVEGRGLHGHELQGRNLLPHLLAKPLWSQIGLPIAEAYDSYVERFDPKRIERPAPFSYIADIVQHADAESADRAHEEGWSAVPRFQELMEAAARVPWKRSEPVLPPQPPGPPEDPDSERDPEATC